MNAIAITGPADLRDQRWLDDRVAAIEDGIEAVLDIARNWSDGRNLARLHPGTSAQSYILARVKHPLGRGVVEPLLAESNWSNRQIAEIAGVDEGTVRNQLRNVPQLDRPTETLGADGKLRPAFRPRLDPEPEPYFAERTVTAVVIDKPLEEPPIDDAAWRELAELLDRIDALTEREATDIAATVPQRRRPATARRIRKLGTFLGRIAWTLEGTEHQA